MHSASLALRAATQSLTTRHISLGELKGRASHKPVQRWEATESFQTSQQAALKMLLNRRAVQLCGSCGFTSCDFQRYSGASPLHQLCLAELEHGRCAWTALKLHVVQRQHVAHPSFSTVSSYRREHGTAGAGSSADLWLTWRSALRVFASSTYGSHLGCLRPCTAQVRLLFPASLVPCNAHTRKALPGLIS